MGDRSAQRFIRRQHWNRNAIAGRCRNRGQGLTTRLLQQALPELPELPGQSSMLREAKTKGEAERFRQFSNQPPLHAPVIGLQTTDPRLACGQDQPQWIVAGMEWHAGTSENRRQVGGVTTTSLQQHRPARRQHPIESGFTGRQQQSTGTGGLKSLQGRLHTLWIDAPVALPEHSGLGQAGS